MSTYKEEICLGRICEKVPTLARSTTRALDVDDIEVMQNNRECRCIIMQTLTSTGE
jgi:hypothetical protein